MFQRSRPSYIPNDYKQTNLDLNLKRQSLPVFIASSPFLQRGSQYTPSRHHRPLTIAWLVGVEQARQEDYYY
jgi:hypothetical protein